MPSSATPVQLVDPDTNTPYRTQKPTAASPSFAKSVGTDNWDNSRTTAPTGTAVQVAAARSGRSAVTIENLTGTQKVWLGSSVAKAAAGTGFLLPGVVGASITIPTQGAIFASADTAAQDLAIFETF